MTVTLRSAPLRCTDHGPYCRTRHEQQDALHANLTGLLNWTYVNCYQEIHYSGSVPLLTGAGRAALSG